MIPSPFQIPGLFRLNLLIVDIPTDRFITDDRGNRDILCRKVAFYLQLDPARRQGNQASEGGAITDDQFFEATIVGTEDLKLDGVESWRSHSLPTGLKMGTQVNAVLNGESGVIRFDANTTTSFLPASQAGFGDRLLVTFSALKRSGNGGI